MISKMSDANDGQVLSAIGSPRRPSPFKPCTIYDKRLDLLVVNLKDCNITLVRQSEYVDVFITNDPNIKKPKFAGFQIWGAEHFARKYRRNYANYEVSNLLVTLEALYTVKIFGDFKTEIIDATKKFHLVAEFT